MSLGAINIFRFLIKQFFFSIHSIEVDTYMIFRALVMCMGLLNNSIESYNRLDLVFWIDKVKSSIGLLE